MGYLVKRTFFYTKLPVDTHHGKSPPFFHEAQGVGMSDVPEKIDMPSVV
jgi:hypothetical protein